MATIEERVLAMKFDGAQFLAGVQNSLNALDKLNKGLKLQEGTKGLDNLGAAAGRQKGALQGIESGVQHISDKFKAMGVVGMTALSNITNQAVFAGQNLVKSLTLAPLMDGFHEYETNMNSIQTILANTQAAFSDKQIKNGDQLKAVTHELDELNHYSDQTIYNFSEMAKNIGTFTAAGVGLKEATASIKGIANLAALSGSNSEQASGAMYQLSQAISAGRVSLEDWNSVVNAGMGGTVFQRALALNAQKMGTLSQGAVKLAGDMKNVTIGGKSFRESITAKPGQESWLTSKVLTQTLAQFTGDLKDADLAAQGFNKSEIKAIQAQAKTAREAATQVKTLTQLFGTIKESVGSGWSQTWKTIFGDFTEARGMFTDVSNRIGKMVSDSSDARNKMLQEWKDNGGRDALIDGISSGFNALLAVIKPIREAFRDIFPATTGKQLADMTKNFAAFTKQLMPSAKTMENLKRTARGFFAVLDIGWMIVKGVAGVIGDLLGVLFEGSGGFLDFTGSIGDWLVKVRDAIKNGDGLKNVFEQIGKVLSVPIKMVKALAGFLGDLASKAEGANVLGKMGDKLKPLGGIGELAARGWSKFLDIIESVWTKMDGLRAWASDFFGEMGSGIAEMVGNLDFKDVLAGINTGLFATLALTIKNFLGSFSGGGDGFLAPFKDALEGVTDTLGAMQNTLRAATLLQIAAAILILAIAMDKLAKIDADGLTRSGAAMTVLFADLMGAMFIFEKFSSFTGFAKMPFVALSMILLAAAVNILATAMTKLSKLDWEELGKGLTGVTVLLGALVGVSRLMGNPEKMIASGLGMIAMAAAIKILVSAVTDLAGLSWEDMARGLTGVAGILLALGLFTKFSEFNKGGVGGGVALLLMAAAIKILASALDDVGGMSWGEILKGLVTMGVAMNIMSVTLRAVPASSAAGAVGLILAATSMLIMGKALQQLADLSWGEIGKSLTVMLGSMLILTAALVVIPPSAVGGAAAMLIAAVALYGIGMALEKFAAFSWEEIAKAGVVLAGTMLILVAAMAAMTGTLPGAAALLVASAALLILSTVMTALGSMSWEEILKSLVALGGAMLVIGLAAVILTPVVPVIIALGIGIGLLGAAIAFAGAGVFLFATGLTLLAAAGTGATAVLVAAISALLAMVPQIVQALGVALIVLSQVIIAAAPALGQALLAILNMLIDVIVAITPKLVDAILKLLTMLMDKLAEYVPKMVDAGGRLIVGILNGIAKNIGKIVDAAVNVATSFLRGIARNVGKITSAGVDVIIALIKGISKSAVKLADEGMKAITSFLKGLASAIRTNSGAMRKAGLDVAVAIIDGMTGGLASGVGKVVSAAKNVASSALNAAKNFLGIHSPSKEFEKVGNFVNDGFRKGLDGNKDQVYAAFNDLKKMLADLKKESSKDVDALEAKLKKLKQKPRTNAKEITKTKKALAQAKKEEKASNLAYNTLTKNLADEKTALGKLAVQYDAVTVKLENVKKTLEDAIKTRDDYNKSITEQYGDIAAPTGETKVEDYIASLKKQLEDTKTFTNTIQRLRALGLNDEVYKDLLSTGTTALPFMQELLNGGKASIDQINSLNKQIDAVSGSLGQNASSALYQAAVDSAAGLVKGLQNQQAAIEKQMDKIADAMVKSIKKKLGIKSPSRVFAEVGGYSAQGLAKGLTDSATTVTKSAEALGNHAVVGLKKSLSNMDKMTLGDVDMTPVIRPKLDLTDIQNGAGKIGGLLPSAKLNLSSAYSNASNAAAALRANQSASDSETASAQRFGSLNYTQINNSPKALSNAEVYRQTKNQLSTVKGALDKNARTS
jgi:tape measure domain-containing protein